MAELLDVLAFLAIGCLVVWVCILANKLDELSERIEFLEDERWGL